MVDINDFFIGFVIVNAVAIALFAAFATVTLTRFFTANRRVRIARRQPIRRYYTHLATGH
ncbi:hypothetical protein [Flexivirga caeni]|uniref:Uncharacterized protein n=1 Tax=Flexivirga caeni TaxID=2294115 RepID=A0A3M9M9B6_9MICO|nr:hypothetical protein [Flexivirga caeni]RNI22149.1 hypothetical protein EFY87_09200 [Flexivirga caeni]